MIYDNCIKYIDKELKRNLIDKEWKQKNFLIYGLDSLGKTVYMLLKEYKVSKLNTMIVVYIIKNGRKMNV